VKKHLGLLAACNLLFLSVWFDGCGNMNAMVEDYNSKFTIVAEESGPPSPGDIDFVERDMLYDEYYVSSQDTLNLAAPFNCDSYEWIMTDPEETYDKNIGPTEIPVVMFGDRDRSSREYVTYIPDSGLETGKTYKLLLRITTDGGTKGYKDACGIVIYEHYDFDDSEAKNSE